MTVQVALVLVSHSAAAAQGTAEIAAQMAPDVAIHPAGGTHDGIGTSFDRVLDAVGAALGDVASGAGDAPGGSGVVVLTDLGSAVLTTESVLEVLDDDAVRVRVPQAPFVEGAVAAAVEAQQGGDLDAVEGAAVRAGAFAGGDGTSPGQPPDVGDPDVDRVTATVVLPNALGLHARPAALLARAVADLGVPVTVDGANGASVLELMQLGATGGRELSVAATGPGAQEAVETVVGLVTEGFGEA